MSPLGAFVRNRHIAYFSMEIALRPEIHSYAGGLGMLAGDTAPESRHRQWPPRPPLVTPIRTSRD